MAHSDSMESHFPQFRSFSVPEESSYDIIRPLFQAHVMEARPSYLTNGSILNAQFASEGTAIAGGFLRLRIHAMRIETVVR